MDSVNSTSSEGTEARPWYRKAMSRTWNGFKYFLELIGILQGQAVDQAAQVARLRLYHTEFRKLLSSNNSFLENLGDLIGQEIEAHMSSFTSEFENQFCQEFDNKM